MKRFGCSLISAQNKGWWHLMEADYEPAHECLVYFAHALSRLLNMHGQLQSGATYTCLYFGLKLLSIPFLERVSSEGSVDAAHKRMRI